MLVALYKTLLLKWRVDEFFNLSFIYLLIMVASGLINQVLFSTYFINYTRIIAEGCLIYYCLINCIKSEKDLVYASICFMLFIFYFLYYSNAEMQSGVSEIVSLNTEVDNRNVLGFTALISSMKIQRKKAMKLS
jgi:hypothetical protein